MHIMLTQRRDEGRFKNGAIAKPTFHKRFKIRESQKRPSERKGQGGLQEIGDSWEDALHILSKDSKRTLKKTIYTCKNCTRCQSGLFKHIRDNPDHEID